MEMGIMEESEGVAENLSNLAIVEVVNVPIRRRRKEYNEVDTPTTGGKNFKNSSRVYQ